MSQKGKTFSSSDIPPCQKYLTKILRQDVLNPRKGRLQDKLSSLSKAQGLQQPKVKPKPVTVERLSPPVKEVQKETKEKAMMPRSKSKTLDREAWGAILKSNKSTDKVSGFGSFDPLRTMHFLSKELHTKLERAIPGEPDILQMVTDIQHALKRIPPEVSSLLHSPKADYTHLLDKRTANRICQTPPTMYQEDKEKFQKIMEENTTRLEASCKQLEQVCVNLQNEKEMVEKQLDLANENIGFLCSRIKELEADLDEQSNEKIVNLEKVNKCLQEELDKINLNLRSSASNEHMKKLVEELKRQKLAADEECAQLQYEITILKMEKEKNATMLAIRDKEVKDIQEEMSKIQDQVYKQLKKLNDDVVQKTSVMKTVTEPPDELMGDTTISSISTNESDNVLRPEASSGDGEALKSKSQPDMLNKADNANTDNKDNYEEFLAELTPSMKSLLPPL